MDKPRMHFANAPDRCATCWAMPSFVDLNAQAMREGRHVVPTCPACGYQPRIRLTAPYPGKLAITKE